MSARQMSERAPQPSADNATQSLMQSQSALIGPPTLPSRYFLFITTLMVLTSVYPSIHLRFSVCYSFQPPGWKLKPSDHFILLQI